VTVLMASGRNPTSEAVRDVLPDRTRRGVRMVPRKKGSFPSTNKTSTCVGLKGHTKTEHARCSHQHKALVSSRPPMSNPLTGGGKYSSLNFFDFCVVTQLYNILVEELFLYFLMIYLYILL